MKTQLLASIALACVPLAAAAAASGSDSRFVKEAVAGGMAEVELGKLAQQKALRDEVKQFASRMVDDHTKANEELVAIASRNGIEVPKGIDESTRKEMDKLQALAGPDFDREYMGYMVKDHRRDLREFRHEAKSHSGSDVQQFAGRNVALQLEHLREAQKTYDISKAR
ncbi:MAG TPA: DUF4142 domain-containing protein [Usitatibacter sp.]|nr:DUF4142 domain-containing protein [Usitatibacter sp.]